MEEMNEDLLCEMYNKLLECAHNHLENIEHVDTHEMGEVIDMIKDLAEAQYYKTLTESMQNKSLTEHVKELVPAISGMYNKADVESKKNIKTHLTKLVADMA